jgi:single-strand DNA-binding protein
VPAGHQHQLHSQRHLTIDRGLVHAQEAAEEPPTVVHDPIMEDPMNSVSFAGNLARDPELRYSPTGRAVCTFGVAVNRRWMNKTTNEWEEQVSFFDVTLFAEQAENAAESFRKGDRVIVTGRLEQQTWETSQGEKRHAIRVIADEIGPSVRWATCQISKPHRRGPGDHPPATRDYHDYQGDVPEEEPF